MMGKGRKPVPVIWNSVTYDSVYAAAAAFGISADAVRYRLRHGLPLDMPFHTKGVVTYGGVEYPSMMHLAAAYGISPQLCSARLIRGIPLDRSIRSGAWSPCEYEGRKYWTLTDFAEAMGLSKEKAKYLINTSGKWLEK